MSLSNIKFRSKHDHTSSNLLA